MTLNDQIAPSAESLVPERMADRIYHDLQSPPDVHEVRSRVRDAAFRSVRPIASRIANADERLDGFPRDVFESMTLDGLFRIPFRTDVGGDGLAHPTPPRQRPLPSKSWPTTRTALPPSTTCTASLRGQ